MTNLQPDDLALSFDDDLAIADLMSEETEDVAVDEMPESFEEETAAELDEAVEYLKRGRKAEAKLKEQNTSTEYWFAVYFATQEQRDFVLNALALFDSLQDQYIGGDDFAKALGVNLPPSGLVRPKPFRKPSNIDDLILDI